MQYTWARQVNDRPYRKGYKGKTHHLVDFIDDPFFMGAYKRWREGNSHRKSLCGKQPQDWCMDLWQESTPLDPPLPYCKTCRKIYLLQELAD